MEVMTRLPVKVSLLTTLRECAKKMIEGRVGSLLIEENGVLKGIMTEKDCVESIAAGIDPEKVAVSGVMNTNVVVVKPDMDVLDAIKLMSEKEVRRLPVVDREGKIVGLVTATDILRVEPELLEIMVEERVIMKGIPKDRSEGECKECGAFTLLRRVGARGMCEECVLQQKAY